MHQRYSQRLPQSSARSWPILLLLMCFLAVRGFVPAGFMPAPLAAGVPYDLCHGDSRSALLLSALSSSGHEQHHHSSGGGQHHDAIAQAFADNHCGFSASAGLATAPVLVLPAVVAVGVQPAALLPSPPPSRRFYLHPPPRAPPVSLPV